MNKNDTRCRMDAARPTPAAQAQTEAKGKASQAFKALFVDSPTSTGKQPKYILANMLTNSGGKSNENLYSSTSTVTLLKYYSITSKSTGVREVLRVLVTLRYF